MKGKMILFLGIGALVMGLASVPAHALTLTPADADFTQIAGGNCDADCVETVTGLSDLTELYKQDVGGVADVGSFAGSYTTTYTADNTGFTITYDGVPDPTITCPTCVLLVKDGSPYPRYFFVTSMSGWDGEEPITGSGFYLAQGGISHVSIFGTPSTNTPEPTSLLLLGAGLAGMWIWRRQSGKI